MIASIIAAVQAGMNVGQQPPVVSPPAQQGIPVDTTSEFYPKGSSQLPLDHTNRLPVGKLFIMPSFYGHMWADNLAGRVPGIRGDPHALLDGQFTSSVALYLESTVTYLTAMHTAADDQAGLSDAEYRVHLTNHALPELLTSVQHIFNAVRERAGLIRLRAVNTDPATRQVAYNEFINLVHANTDVGAPLMNKTLQELEASRSSAFLKQIIKNLANKEVDQLQRGKAPYDPSRTKTGKEKEQRERDGKKKNNTANQTTHQGGAASGSEPGAKR